MGDDLQGHELERFIELVKELDIEDRMKHLNRALYYAMPWGRKKSTEQFNEVVALITKAINARIANNNTEQDFFNFLIAELRTENGTLLINAAYST